MGCASSAGFSFKLLYIQYFNLHTPFCTVTLKLHFSLIMCAGGIWKDPSPISACFTDGKLVTGAAWPGHPEFLKQLLQVLSATVEGGDKKVLMLCGVSN